MSTSYATTIVKIFAAISSAYVVGESRPKLVCSQVDIRE